MKLAPNPTVKVSWGELVDKITILEIKERHLRSPDAIVNVRRELALLNSEAKKLDTSAMLTGLKNELRVVNESLWDIEDEIRAKEASQSFDEHFVELARLVYLRNDERGSLKRRIDLATNSEVREEKQYTQYGRAQGTSPRVPGQGDGADASESRGHQPLLTRANLRMKQCKHGLMMFHVNDAYIGRSLDRYGEFCEGEMDLFGQFLRPGMTVVDAGANIGVHTLYFAEAVGPGGLVFAFEPQRVLYQMLCGNIVLNGHANVVAENVGLAAEVGTAVVPKIDYTKGGNFGGVSLQGPTSGEKVQVKPLDSVGLSACHLIKIDVEGMEQLVLQGAARLLGEHQPLLYVENDRVERSQELIQWLRTNGYRPFWHRPRLFNPKNYFAESENVFGDIVSINMFCVPRSQTVAVPGLREVIA